MLTSAFKNGDSMAVRIPKEMAFMRESDALEVKLIGNTLMLRPAASPDLQDLAEIIALFPPGFMAAGRDAHDEAGRDWECDASRAPHPNPLPV